MILIFCCFPFPKFLGSCKSSYRNGLHGSSEPRYWIETCDLSAFSESSFCFRKVCWLTTCHLTPTNFHPTFSLSYIRCFEEKKHQKLSQAQRVCFKPPFSFHDLSRWIFLLDVFRSIEKIGKHPKRRIWWRIQKFPQNRFQMSSMISSSSVRFFEVRALSKKIAMILRIKRFLRIFSQLPASQLFSNGPRKCGGLHLRPRIKLKIPTLQFRLQKNDR